MERSRTARIREDLTKRIVLLTGPRQVGKTWLSRRVMEYYRHPLYLNVDAVEDRRVISERSWLPTVDLLVLDELHKFPDWKNYLKGLYDTRPPGLHLLVTGSARLEWSQSMGDSLAGRFYSHRLMPFSPGELAQVPHAELGTNEDIIAERLIDRGGFPEPFLGSSDQEADRWRLQYIQSALLLDALDLTAIRSTRAFRATFELLRRGVGSPISYASIAQDAQVSVPTVIRFVEILEALFVVFRVSPYSRRIARSLRRAPKLYFYDTGLVQGEEGARFENSVAVSLWSHVSYLRDAEGKDATLQYLRTKEGREVNFCIVLDELPSLIVESKTSGEAVHRGLRYFHERTGARAIQLVRTLRQERIDGKIELRRPWSFLSELTA